MIESFKSYFFTVCGIKPEARIILAISGGLDSCVLLDLFLKSKITLALAHCNFQLRAQESDENELFVKNLAEKNNLPIFIKHFNTNELVANSSDSIQMIARKLRYDWFNQLLLENNYEFVATAHHKNDVLETCILNFTRGTGISGFHGIKPQNGILIRPLLFAKRDEISAYSKNNNIDYQEDSSNNSMKYHRNLIRHEVITQLKKINPNIENTIEQTVEKVSAVEAIYEQFVVDFKSKFTSTQSNNFYIDKAEIKKNKPFFLYSLIENYGFNYAQAKQISMTETVGSVFYACNYELHIERQKIVIYRKKNDENDRNDTLQIFNLKSDIVVGDKTLKFESVLKSHFTPSRDLNTIFLDESTIKLPLTLRHWKVGDKIQPFGMKGKKNVSDILIDKKVSMNDKSNILVLESSGQIIWVLGYVFSEKFRIHENCLHIIKICVLT